MIFKKGHRAWNKGTAIPKPKCITCQKTLSKLSAKYCKSHVPITKARRSKYRKHMLGNSHAKGKNLGNQHGFKKGFTPFNKGGHNLWATGENHHFWKGDQVGYFALHSWVERNLGKPKLCEHCGKDNPNKRYHWANKSRKYLRSLSDWIRLCVSCHIYYDKHTNSNTPNIRNKSNR